MRMTPLAIVLLLVSLVNAGEVFESNTAFGYLQKYGIPAAEEIRKAEEEIMAPRIVGGRPAVQEQFPYQAGLLITLRGSNGTAVCGASLLNANRLITAGHCWYDGVNRGQSVEVVLGSTKLFSEGTRIQSSNVTTHPNWNPRRISNDVAIIYLPRRVSFSSTIAPIALPSGEELEEDFMGYSAVASGYGLTSDGGAIRRNQTLSHVTVRVISNSLCGVYFPTVVKSSNVCTVGIGQAGGTCRGDSGGPLVVANNGRLILIGVTSFGSSLGCEVNFPAAYSRVTSFMDFINRHL